MRKIYVLNEQGNLETIDAGITSYSELSDAPIITSYKGVPLINSTIFINEETQELDIQSAPGHRWTEEEVLLWCQSVRVTARYDIITESEGAELLLVDYTNEMEGGRFRRITVEQDMVYDASAGWTPISDLSAKQLIFRITNLNDLIEPTFAVGSKVVMNCYYYSTVNDGTLTVKKGEKTVAATTLKRGQTTLVDLTYYIEDGDNVFTYLVTNNGSGTLKKEDASTVVIKGMQLTYTSRFSVTNIKQKDVSFTFNHSGSIPKTAEKCAYFTITNASGHVSHVTHLLENQVATGQETVVLSADYFDHGENVIETYLGARYIGAEEPYVTTEVQAYHFPYATNSSSIVMTYFDYASIQEWSTISIPYRIWNTDRATTDAIRLELKYYQKDNVAKYITQEYNSLTPVYVDNYLTANTEHKWQLSNMPYGVLTFNIYLGEFERNENNDIVMDEETNTPIYKEWKLYYSKVGVDIEQGEYSFNTIDGYLFNFAANDINSTNPFDVWTSKNYELELSGLNWITDGVKTETDRSIKLTSAGRMVMKDGADLFNYANGDAGMTVEFDFKVDSSADNTKPIIRYGDWNEEHQRWNSRFGIIVYPTHVAINYDTTSAATETLVINYQKGERINLGLTIDPSPDKNAAEGEVVTPVFIKVYLNGIISSVVLGSETVKYPLTLNRFEFNCSGNAFDLYGFRGYNRPLSSTEMLQNYISNFASVDTKTKMLVDNNIYDAKTPLVYGDEKTPISGEQEVSLQNTIGKIGCLVVIMDSLPTSKAYLPCHTVFYEKDNNNREVEWDDENNRSMATTYYKKADGSWNTKAIKVGGQGTSSMSYPRKNLKFKFKDKLYIKGHKDGKDKTITCKADYMDSSGANNICNAQITENAILRDRWVVNADNVTPAYLGARVNLDGFPVCIFHATHISADGIPYCLDENGTEIEPRYTGIYNFNYDKKPKALLGWEKYKDANGNTVKFKFQGFEFRDNTSTMCLQTGIPNFLEFVNADKGYEWRWTTQSDWVDDFHDMNLGILWDGAYASEKPINKADEKDDTIFEYTEADYIKYRIDKEVQVVPAFNQLFVENADGTNQLYRKIAENNYVPVNYSDLGQGGDAWHQDFGLKFATGEDGEPALYWQRPYGAQSTTKGLAGGSLYESGEGYYKYRRNPEHKCYFEYNDEEEYFNDLSKWSKVYNLSDLYVQKVTYTENPTGDYLKDPVDKLYHPYSYYTFYSKNGDGEYVADPNGTYIEKELDDDDNMTYTQATERFDRTVEYLSFSVNDKLIIKDLMKDIFANWYYCIDTLCHIKPVTDAEGNLSYPNYNKLIDCSQTYSDELGDNGNGLFILDALLNYYASSVTVGLCDNFCKNMMIHSYDDGKTWSPAWYDMDTCFGLNNTGFYVFDYDVDFQDPGVFNGSTSTLWKGLYTTFMTKIEQMYRELRDTNKLSYENNMKIIYDGNIKYKSESMYNSSAFDRYIVPKLENKSGTVLEAAQGNRLSLLKYWLSNRQTYLDSRYGSGIYSDDVANMRFYAPVSFDLNVVPDTTMYLGFSFNQAEADMPAPNSRSPKVKAGDTWSYHIDVVEPLNDLNTKIFGASHLLDFGDLGLTVPKYVDIKAAHLLRRLILGTDDPVALARHEQITKEQGLNIELPLKVSPNMKEIDLHNLKY